MAHSTLARDEFEGISQALNVVSIRNDGMKSPNTWVVMRRVGGDEYQRGVTRLGRQENQLLGFRGRLTVPYPGGDVKHILVDGELSTEERVFFGERTTLGDSREDL